MTNGESSDGFPRSAKSKSGWPGDIKILLGTGLELVLVGIVGANFILFTGAHGIAVTAARMMLR